MSWRGLEGCFFDLTGSDALTFATASPSGLLAIGCMWAGRSRSLVPSSSGRRVGEGEQLLASVSAGLRHLTRWALRQEIADEQYVQLDE